MQIHWSNIQQICGRRLDPNHKWTASWKLSSHHERSTSADQNWKLKNLHITPKAILYHCLILPWKSTKTATQLLTSIQEKGQKKLLFVHHKSLLPISSKKNIIKNEKYRIAQRCSSSKTKKTRNKEFDDILRLNGYPEQIIDQSNSTKQNHRTEKRNQTDWLAVVEPFLKSL